MPQAGEPEGKQGNDVELYLVHGAGHGTPEFFQPSVQKIALDFFARTLG